MECDQCGRQMEKLSYTCSKCGEEFCAEHRLPESHDCMGLKVEKAERALKREEGEEVPWFDDNVSGGGESDNTIRDRVNRSWLTILMVILLGGLFFAFVFLT